MPATPCIFCLRRIYKNSRAVTCDNCRRWHHIKCGNTGISIQEYEEAVNERDLQFTCLGCRPEEPVPLDTYAGDHSVEQDPTLNYSDLELPVTESTRNSFASAILQDKTVDESHTFNAPSLQQLEESTLDTSVNNTSTFDVSRPERSMVLEEPETSLADETVTYVPPSAAVTYEIIEKGTQRGKPKFVSLDGYAYVINRKFPSGTVDWRCSVRRRKDLACSATVKQTGESLITSSREHSHPANPGSIVSVHVKKTRVRASGGEELHTTDITWMTNNMCPVESWSQCGRSVRANNNCEG